MLLNIVESTIKHSYSITPTQGMNISIVRRWLLLNITWAVFQQYSWREQFNIQYHYEKKA
jgi:hypothetical protein